MITLKEHVFRSDIEEFFKLTDITTATKLNHTPFIVFNGDLVELCFNAKELVDTYPPETKVIAQWRGQWRSDFFRFTVGDIIKFLNYSHA